MAQTQVFRGTARKIVETEHNTHFYYHETLIVTLTPDNQVTLNSGRHRTNTTKTAMNQVANQYCGSKWGVFQKNFDWYVNINGEIVEFYDGMTFTY